MLYNYLTEYLPLAIFFTIGIFAFIKLVTVKITRLPDSGSLFVESFGLYSEQYIRNTFHKQMQSYYKSSNKINSWFYLFLCMLLAVYGFIVLVIG
ncbi:hypothetical protein [Polluticoccus soli]|uniref:hypothetical protein n=1 Tax=Polluticoccus soli TaxID=3034150 RepID=UPI0023E16DB2|nr:hypothetical protein [Flavipsychrobacter sp. JY13-12]